MANVDIRLGHKNTTWFTTNSTLVLKDGQMVVCSDGANQGKYKIGDGVTQLSALTFYGGSGYAFTGLTSQYTRGDGSYATFPTNVSSFTNDSGYITSSALSPYLTIANASLTYQPIGSYLTGLTVGSTVIGSGTSSRILYNNGGVLGEYSVTGTGTTAVLSTSPTFTTNITTPLIIGGTGVNQTLTFKNTTGTQSSTGTCYNFLAGDGSNLINIVYRTFTFSPRGTASGAVSSFIFSPENNTGQTASTEINGYLYNSYSRQWAAGAINNQRERYYKTVTYAFASASTITNAYGAYFEAPTAGTNATINNNWSLGTNGNLLCQGSLVSSSPSGGVGYFTGAGSTVTQTTSRTTGVTINNVCGSITLVSAAGTATWQSFTVTNSRVAATDVIKVVQSSGTDLYQIFITNVAAGSFQITFATTGGTTTEQPVFNFSIIKAVTA